MEKREPILKIHSLTKEFPGVKAVSEADLELFGGEVHSIVGGNGAGKSTLMKMLAGVYPYHTWVRLSVGERMRFRT